MTLFQRWQCLVNGRLLIPLLCVMAINSIDAFAAVSGPEDVMASMLYLHVDSVETVELDGTQYVACLQSLADKSIRPKITTVTSGSASLVSFKGQLYIVTADHVADGFREAGQVTVRADDGSSQSFDLKTIVGSDPPFRWIRHDRADVAVLPINPVGVAVKTPITLKPLDAALFETRDPSPALSQPLAIVGFPLNLGTRGTFSPLVKTTHSASGLFVAPRADNKREATFFALQDPAAEGFSGAPVFAVSRVEMLGVAFGGGRFEAVGIVHGVLFDRTGGKFAVVTPARYVVEALTKAATAPTAVTKP